MKYQKAAILGIILVLLVVAMPVWWMLFVYGAIVVALLMWASAAWGSYR